MLRGVPGVVRLGDVCEDETATVGDGPPAPDEPGTGTTADPTGNANGGGCGTELVAPTDASYASIDDSLGGPSQPQAGHSSCVGLGFVHAGGNAMSTDGAGLATGTSLGRSGVATKCPVGRLLGPTGNAAPRFTRFRNVGVTAPRRNTFCPPEALALGGVSSGAR